MEGKKVSCRTLLGLLFKAICGEGLLDCLAFCCVFDSILVFRCLRLCYVMVCYAAVLCCSLNCAWSVLCFHKISTIEEDALDA